MPEYSGTSSMTGTNADCNSQTVSVSIDWEHEYNELKKKYDFILQELDSLGYTLLSYARAMKQPQQQQQQHQQK